MNTTTPRTIARRVTLVAGIAASLAAVAPGAASAGGIKASCTGTTLAATADHQTLVGTACADTFYVRGYRNVTVQAGDGNDKVYAGYGTSNTYLYLGNGNDVVRNDHNRPVWVQAGAGNDVVEGHSGYDAIFGGPGTDTAEISVGDHYESIEVYLAE